MQLSLCAPSGRRWWHAIRRRADGLARLKGPWARRAGRQGTVPPSERSMKRCASGVQKLMAISHELARPKTLAREASYAEETLNPRKGRRVTESATAAARHQRDMRQKFSIPTRPISHSTNTVVPKPQTSQLGTAAP